MNAMHLFRKRWFEDITSILAFVALLVCVSSSDCSSDLDNALQKVPSCALPCVKNFINNEFEKRACCHRTDFACLCRTNSTSGLTLGEAALVCVVSSCPPSIASGADVYGICAAIPGALPQTHQTITATVLTTSTKTLTNVASSTVLTTVIPSSSVSTTSRESATTSSRVSTTRLSTSSISNPIAESPTNTSSPTPSPSEDSQSSPLSSPAVIGLSVASGISAAFLAGVLVVFCGRKYRRRRLAAEREGFEIGGEMSEPPNFGAPSGSSPALSGIGAHITPPGPNFHQFPLQPVSRSGPLVAITPIPEEMPSTSRNAGSVQPSPVTDYTASPRSESSQRSVSRLLPNNTRSDLYPEPLRVSDQNEPTSERSTSKDETKRPENASGRVALQDDSKQQNQWQTANSGLALYPIGRSQPEISQSGGKKQPQTGNQLNDSRWGSPGRGQTIQRNDPNQMRPERNFSRLGAYKESSRQQYRFSTESDTSFETVGVDEDSHTDQVTQQLRRIDISVAGGRIEADRPSIKYPAVPPAVVMPPPIKVGPASERTPSSNYSTRASSETAKMTPSDQKRSMNVPLYFAPDSARSRSNSPSSSLLAKRRGETVADRMELEFGRGSVDQRNAQLGRGRRQQDISKEAESRKANASDDRQPNSSTSSPREHQITPSRRGEDLYLSVD